jgi:hypothetical protein
MKRNILAFVMLLLTGLVIVSCKKNTGDDKDDNNGFSEDIKRFVPAAVIDSMRKWGLAINEGKIPPVIEGIYDFKPNYCIHDNSGYNREGSYFLDYRLRFRAQNNQNLTVSLDFKSLGAAIDTATGTGSFLAGSNNSFTAFVDVSGVSYGIPYKAITFYSGVVSNTGITNFQTGYYLKEKGADPGNLLVPVGTSRIFNDEDSFSEIKNAYRQAPTENAREKGILEK